MDANRIRDCKLLAEPALSLNYTPEGEDSSEFQDFLADDSQPDAEMLMDQKQTRWVLSDLLLRLNRREREVLRLYFGMDTGVTNSLGEIANRFGLSRERVRQIKKRGLAYLGRFIKLSEGKSALV
jgi:RNA polymerase sigma factor (sigma-70 family)